jgi:hypothetical protein
VRIGFALAAVLALSAVASFSPPAHGQDGLTVGIDMDTSGNDDSTVGAIDECAEIAGVGDTITIDVVITGVPDSVRIQGYQTDIDYDPSILKVVEVIDVDEAGSTPPNNVTMISRINSVAGPGFIPLTEGPLPDEDGSFTVAAADGTAQPAPPDNHESGEGVLARITFEAVGEGVSNLLIGGPDGGQDGIPDLIILGGKDLFLANAVLVTSGFNGAVGVGTECVPPPPAELPDMPGALPIDGSAPDGAGATDDDGAGELPGVGGEPGDDSLSAGAWIGIVLGILAALAAGGAGGYYYGRRRA